MKTLFFLTMIMIASCSHIPAKNDLNINELKAAMSYGTMRQLNDIDPDIEKDLLVRLYQVPMMDGNCFIETHGICQNKYYLSVSTFDEFPETNIFRLNIVGEVSGVHWLQEDITDHVKIEFTFNKYTKEAMKNNSSLVNFQSKILVELDPNTLEEIVRQLGERYKTRQYSLEPFTWASSCIVTSDDNSYELQMLQSEN